MNRTSAIVVNFHLEVNDTEQGHYGPLKLQLTLHPEEPFSYTSARALAASHNFSEAIQIGPGWYDSREPTFYEIDPAGDLDKWVHVGEIDKQAIKRLRTLKSKTTTARKTTTVRVYFYNVQQVEKFCHSLRGSKENWIGNFQFYLISPTLVETLDEEWESAESDSRRNSRRSSRRISWDCCFVEGALYLSDRNTEKQFEGKIELLDMWNMYQQHLTFEGISDQELHSTDLP